MFLTALNIGIVLCASAILIAAAVSDIRSYKIPNKYCAALFFLYPMFVLSSPVEINWQYGVIVFFLVAAIGFSAFAAGMMGAGDIKLLSLTGLWAGVDHVSTLLIATALIGGVESLILAVRARMRGAVDIKELKKIKVPYGVAISLGGLSVMFMIAKSVAMKV